MTTQASSIKFIAALVALSGLASTAIAQATFQRLGALPDAAPASSALKLSRDGRAVSGTSVQAGVTYQIRWSEMDGLVKLSATAAPYASDGVSRSGRFVTGGAAAGGGIEAYRWTVAGGMQTLGDLSGGPHRSVGSAVSADGSVVAGIADATYEWPTITGQAFRWTQATGLVGLGFAGAGHDLSEVWAMTPDGSVLVGDSGKNFVKFHAFRWTQATGMVDLGDLPGSDDYSVAVDVTSDGQTLVGVCSPAAGYEAFRWTSGTGMVALGDLPGGEHYSAANGVSEDGNIIVGVADWDGGFGDQKAFIWDPINGMRSLQQVLQAQEGLDLSGWTLLTASGISADGTVIVGDGLSPEGHTEAWMVTMPKQSCPADLNGDGLVDFADYLEFLNLYNAGC